MHFFTKPSVSTILESPSGPSRLQEELLSDVEIAIQHALPQMHVHLRNVTISATVAAPEATNKEVTHELPTIGRELAGMFRMSSSAKKEKRILHQINAVLQPGTMTLVLGQPGSGKSSLLKVLSGRFPHSKNTTMEGEITYNGVTQAELNKRLPQFVSYVPQRDRHFPTLTVRETLEFAHECCGSELSARDEAHFTQGTAEENKAALEAARAMYRHYPEIVTQQLGLEHCQDTIVGDSMVRGVSGGERKRVTTGEMEFGNKYVTLMDEISTGLDSAATYDIVKTQRSIARKLRKTVVMALLQPSPEVFDLFDNVILLHQGRVLFNGPCSSVVPYFRSIGLLCPPERDVADFLLDIGTPSQAKYETLNESLLPRSLSVDDLAEAYERSALHHAVIHELQQPLDAAAVADFKSQVLETPEFHLPFFKSVMLLTKREVLVTWRNTEYMGSRVFMVIFIGFINATLDYQMDPSNFQLVVGTLFTVLLYFSLTQAALTPMFVAGRDIFYKQRDANFYRASAYVCAVAINQILLALPEALLFSLCMYFFFGLVATVAAFAKFVGMLFLTDIAFTSMTFLLSTLFSTAAVVESMATLSTLMFALFAGAFITKANIPVYFVWAYWLNPISWSLRALSIDQYSDERYAVCAFGGIDYCQRANQTMGEFALTLFDFSTDTNWYWYAVIYLVAMVAACFALASVVIERVRHHEIVEDLQTGFSSEDNEGKGDGLVDATGARGSNYKAMAGSTTTYSHTIVQPVTVAFKDLRYSIPDPASPKHSQLELLRGVSGYAVPGTVTALMGSSGAGKTTLMDVIAGRKTGGKVAGAILFNGHAATDLAVQRCTGYCEQMDMHSQAATFREALAFSAHLRQGSDVADADKAAAVEEMLDLLALRGIADKIIRGSSLEQLKRLSIGVELVAQPSVLFLDEPTSGLDAHTAKKVMDCVRRVADTGRTVICTIHQPSLEVFQLFDNLLLLKLGGDAVYFGAVRDVVPYFEAIAGVPPMRAGANPATWMLEVLGAGVGVGGSSSATTAELDFAGVYESSGKRAELARALERPGVGVAMPGVDPLAFSSKRAASNWTQFTFLLRRFARMYWRSGEYNLTRLAVGTSLALMFGLSFGRTELDTYKGVTTAVMMIGLASVFVGAVAFDSIIPFSFADRGAFYRERAAQSYNTLWYGLASTLVEIPYVFAMGLLFVGVFFPLAGFATLDGSSPIESLARFLLYWFYVSLHVLLQTYIGQTLAFASPSVEVASTLSVLLTSVNFLFMGFNPPAAAIPRGYEWLHYLVAPKYTLAILSTVVFGDCESAGSDAASCHVLLDAPPTLPENVTTAEYLDSVFLIRASDVWRNVGILLVFLAVSRVLVLLVLRFVRHGST